MGWTAFKDMAMTDDDILDMATPIPIASKDRPRYPYGLRICLTHKELEKLGLEADCCVGDLIDLRAMAKVTSVSMNDTEGGQECRVELQIEQLAVENEADEGPPGDTRRSPLYDRSRKEESME